MRSSIHLTGRPPALRDSSTVMSVPRVPPLPPKLPPWGWAIMRTLLDGRPRAAARAQRDVRGGLEARPQREALVDGIPLGDHAEGLERVGAEAMPAELLA